MKKAVIWLVVCLAVGACGEEEKAEAIALPMRDVRYRVTGDGLTFDIIYTNASGGSSRYVTSRNEWSSHVERRAGEGASVSVTCYPVEGAPCDVTAEILVNEEVIEDARAYHKTTFVNATAETTLK